MSYDQLIEFATNQSISWTINLNAAGLLRGVGSKQVTISSSADPIIRVGSNLINSSGGWDDRREINAVIENIVLKGGGREQGQTAILLNDVYGCQIRNVAIEDVYYGIKLTTTTNNWMGCEATRIEHVRMNDVGRGIEFLEGDGSGLFGHTHIEDVGIALENSVGLVGIGITSNCKMAAAFMKANVWSTNICTGMYADNEMHTGIVNFNHERTSGPSGGYGISFGQNAAVANNHDFDHSYGFFLAVGGNIGTVDNLGNNEVTVKTY